MMESWLKAASAGRRTVGELARALAFALCENVQGGDGSRVEAFAACCSRIRRRLSLSTHVRGRECAQRGCDCASDGRRSAVRVRARVSKEATSNAELHTIALALEQHGQAEAVRALGHTAV